MKTRLNIPRLLLFMSMSLSTSLLTLAPSVGRSQTPDPSNPPVKIVLVENPDIGPGEGRLNFPLLINNGKGFKIKCQSQNDEEKVIRGLGFITMPSVVLDPLSDEVVHAAPEEQPLLCPYSAASYKIKLYRFNPGTGDKFYLQFPAGFNEHSYGDNLYVAGCSQLLDGLALNVSQAMNADPTPFFQDRIFPIDCFTGSPIAPTPKNFGEWCAKKDLTPEQKKTVTALLAYSPAGVGALGNELKCKEADAFLNTLTTLNLSGQGLTDVSPLGVFSNLTQLILTGNQVADVAPLAGMRSLTLLNLSQNKIQNVAGLAAMAQLKELGLANNSVTDVRPLSSLMNLVKLNLSNNGLADSSLTSITFLSNLKELNLSRNNIYNPTSLKDMVTLEKLDLSYNKIAALSVVQGFRAGLVINLEGNPFISMAVSSYYDYCTLIKYGASVPTSKLATFKVLEDMMKAVSVDPQDCAAADNWAKSQTNLNLSNKGLTDVGPLQYFPSLTNLDLSKNNISDVTPLGKLTQMRKLYLQDNSIENVEPLANLYNLEVLILARNRIISSFSLGGLSQWKVIDLRDNKIKTLDKVKRMLERARDRGAVNPAVMVGVYFSSNSVCSQNFLVVITGNPILDALQEGNKKLNIVKNRACSEIPPAI